MGIGMIASATLSRHVAAFIVVLMMMQQALRGSVIETET